MIAEAKGGGKDQLPARMARDFLLGKHRLTDAVRVGLSAALHDRALVARILAAHKHGAKLGVAVRDKADLGAIVRDPKFDWGVEGKRGASGRPEGEETGGGEARQSVQRRAAGPGAASQGEIHRVAREGLRGPSQPLPHQDAIQRAFGPHDVSGIQAHVGGTAQASSEAMGASAYASGNAVAFREAPDLHTAAHEAAHVVQQRGGVQLAGGVGKAGDRYEVHADAVADRVVRGESAVDLLPAGQSAAPASVQRRQAAGGPAGGGQERRATDLLQEAVQVIETALAVASGELDGELRGGRPAAGTATRGNTGSVATTGADPSGPKRASTEVVGHLQVALQELRALHGAPDEQIRHAVAPILAQVGVVSQGSGAAESHAAPPVQRNSLVLGAPLLAAGPPGWVAYAVLGVATVGLMGYAGYQAYRSRARERARAEPRAIPRTREESPQHRGRLQVQGGGLELAFPWARPLPMTKAEGLAGLLGLKAMLTRGQLAERDEAFADAAGFIALTLHTCPPDVSRTFQNRAVRQRRGDERVDVEIRTGVAFV